MKKTDYLAKQYADKLEASKAVKMYAEEDFAAGYQSAKLQHEWFIRQLQHIIDIAEKQQEQYSLSIARFTLAQLTKE